MEPLGIDLNYSPGQRNKSFCLGLQGPLILAIHAICFASSLSGIFTREGGKQIFGNINPSPSPGDRRLDPGGIGSKYTFGHQDTVWSRLQRQQTARDKLFQPLAQLTGG